MWNSVGYAGLVLLAWLVANPATAQPPAASAGPNAAHGQLTIEGKSIETLTLEDKQGRSQAIRGTDSTPSLPPGEYRVTQVVVQGGYASSASVNQEWLTVRPGQPVRVRAGAPLKPTVHVTRQGRVLTLDYQLLDAAGRNYAPQERTNPPRFTVNHGGCEIGAGVFEYG